MIATDIDDVNSTDCAEDAAGGFIGATNDGNSMDCSDIKFSDDAADGLIAITIDAGILTDCSEDAAGGLIAASYAGVSTNFTNKYISDDAADGLVVNPIDADGLIATPIDSTENADTNVLDYAIDGLMMLMC